MHDVREKLQICLLRGFPLGGGIYEMPSLTKRPHKASLEQLLVQFSYPWQRECVINVKY